MLSKLQEAFLEEIRECSHDELVDRKREVDMDLSSVKSQIGAAKARLITTGVYADPDWYNKANAAQRYLGWCSQILQQEMGKAKKRESNNQSLSFERKFMEVARLLLPEQTYAQLIEETRAMCK